MSRIRTASALFLSITLSIAIVASCSDDTTIPGDETECEPVTLVTPSITAGEEVVFNWQPPCGMMFLTVEGASGEFWAIRTPEEARDSPDEAHRIFPPVTYGQPPLDAPEDGLARPLVEGESYELILWRLVPAGATGDCLATLDDACVVARESFTR